MAPQATLVVPTPTAFLQPAPAHHKTFIPVALLVFLALCLAYTLSYVVYRAVMAHRRAREQDILDSPDRSMSHFMSADRLTLNPDQHRNSAALSESPNVPDAEKPPTDSSHPTSPEVPAISPADTSSPTFAGQLQEQGPSKAQTSGPSPTRLTTQRPFSQRIAAKVKFLSRDRAEAIALDPKLAPVQGPIRPLSMVPSPPRRKQMTLFGFSLKHSRSLDQDSHTNLEAQ